ncbi:MAG: hypothetical protein ACI81A_000940, partial [Paraglaciecola sp.]
MLSGQLSYKKVLSLVYTTMINIQGYNWSESGGS